MSDHGQGGEGPRAAGPTPPTDFLVRLRPLGFVRAPYVALRKLLKHFLRAWGFKAVTYAEVPRAEVLVPPAKGVS